ncbi:hypothetical protein [Entomohabitans teleogrylli]|uniref:hypothetical protein n=1 Tax=Entomohabitans teleogrylli TaxID=1384589 RepID=UPI0008FC7632|nr:hypothetical protein [Entomohabitans teleogrylli]
MQRQAMGVALHIVLLPFLNYCIAQLIRTTPAQQPAFFACYLAVSWSKSECCRQSAHKYAGCVMLSGEQMIVIFITSQN